VSINRDAEARPRNDVRDQFTVAVKMSLLAV
jgi:hypothetical protein